MMKKIVFLFAMMLMSVSGFAQQAKEIIDSYRGNEKVQVIDANKTTVGMLLSLISKSETEKELLKNAETLTALAVTDKEMTDEIFRKFATLVENGYEKWTDGDNDVVQNFQLYYKVENDSINNFLMIGSSQGFNLAAYITGKFSKEQLAAMIKNK